jgi:hypothetical protein
LVGTGQNGEKRRWHSCDQLTEGLPPADQGHPPKASSLQASHSQTSNRRRIRARPTNER